jgi:AcrR family transcriptional regulator
MRSTIPVQREDISSTSERILQIATRLFAEKGFANVSIREICEAANASLPMVYYYFKDKDGLFQAVVRRTISMEDFIVRLNEELTRVTAPDAQLRIFIRTYLLAFPRELANVGFYLRDSTVLDKQSSGQFSAGLDKVYRIAQDLIEAGLGSGIFCRTDSTKAADCLLGMMNRFVFQGVHFQRDYDPEAIAAYVSDFFIRALRRDAPTEADPK